MSRADKKAVASSEHREIVLRAFAAARDPHSGEVWTTSAYKIALDNGVENASQYVGHLVTDEYGAELVSFVNASIGSRIRFLRHMSRLDQRLSQSEYKCAHQRRLAGPSFNGAAFLRARKGDADAVGAAYLIASMGPRAYERGRARL